MKNSEFLEKAIATDIDKIKEKFLIFDDGNLDIEISKEIEEHIKIEREKLERKYPYSYEKQKYEDYKFIKKIFEHNDAIKLIKKMSIDSNIYFDENFWNESVNKLKSETQTEKKAFDRLLINEMEKHLTKISKEWENKEIIEIRKKLNSYFDEKFSKLMQLRRKLIEIEGEYGFLWDLLKKDIKITDIETLNKWIEILNNNKEIVKLSDLFGKMRKAKNLNVIKKQEKIIENLEYSIKIPDINSNEEISGIKFGKDIANVVPSELVLLNDENFSIIFDLKFVENKLMCFDFQGEQEIEQKNTIEKFIEKEENKEQEEKGPVIICVDTSGSMYGNPEMIAKAISFCVISKALTEKRACFLINFSVNVEVMEFTELSQFSNLLEFLKKSFHGGTDIQPAIEFAIEKLENEKYKKADILILSDFIVNDMGHLLKKRIQEVKKLENKFYAITITESPIYTNNELLNTIFTKQWVYNFNSSNIELLDKIAWKYDK